MGATVTLWLRLCTLLRAFSCELFCEECLCDILRYVVAAGPDANEPMETAREPSAAAAEQRGGGGIAPMETAEDDDDELLRCAEAAEAGVAAAPAATPHLARVVRAALVL